MLYEDDVLAAVCRHLESQGWTISSRALTVQHGDDVVAVRGDEQLIVEAKGAGSSKEGTKRYGSEFNLGQVRTHVAVAVLRALAVASSGAAGAAIAVPDDVRHRRVLGPVLAALADVPVLVLLVDERGGVREVSTAEAL